jgi:hypothetical protein
MTEKHPNLNPKNNTFNKYDDDTLNDDITELDLDVNPSMLIYRQILNVQNCLNRKEVDVKTSVALFKMNVQLLETFCISSGTVKKPEDFIKIENIFFILIEQLKKKIKEKNLSDPQFTLTNYKLQLLTENIFGSQPTTGPIRA